MKFLLSIGLTYYFAAMVQTVFHRLFGHKNRIAAIFETHAKGHHRIYRVPKLLTDKYLDDEYSVMWYYAIPVLPVFILLLMFTSTQVILGFAVGLVFSIWWHIHLHKHYHLTNSFWNRYQWFHTKRELHFVHHMNVKTNYAIVEYWIDDLMRTKKLVSFT